MDVETEGRYSQKVIPTLWRGQQQNHWFLLLLTFPLPPKRELLNKKGCVLNSQVLNGICKHFCPASVRAREGSPQSPQLPTPTVQLKALAATPLSSQGSSKLQKNDAFGVGPQCFVLSHTLKHSVRYGTVQGRHRTSAPHLHLCSAQIIHKWCCHLPTVSSTHFSLASVFWAITPTDHQPVHSSGWQPE